MVGCQRQWKPPRTNDRYPEEKVAKLPVQLVEDAATKRLQTPRIGSLMRGKKDVLWPDIWHSLDLAGDSSFEENESWKLKISGHGLLITAHILEFRKSS